MNVQDLHDKKTAIDFYDKRYEDGYMEEWDEIKKNNIKEVLGLFNLPQKGKALDFGCGNGVFTNIIKTALPNWKVYGVEISPTAIKNAKNKFPNCNFFEISEADTHTGSFDLLFSHHVIEHIQNLEETFSSINNYLKPAAYQLHILPCGNVGSFEYDICTLVKDGINANMQNRFFFEEPGHLRRLNTEQFVEIEKSIGFTLEKDFYSNQYFGAINWITKSSPRFVKKLTNPDNVLNNDSRIKLIALRKKLIPLTYFQFPYSKYWAIKSKWRKNFFDFVKLGIYFFPAMISKILYTKLDAKSANEWQNRKAEKNGSEMFLFFKR